MDNKKIEPRTRIEKILNKIADNVGSEAPEKFVINFDGVWDSSENTSSCDKTFAEIREAYVSGRTIEALYGQHVLHLTYVSVDAYFNFYCYYKVDFAESTYFEVNAEVYADGKVKVQIDGDVNPPYHPGQ